MLTASFPVFPGYKAEGRVTSPSWNGCILVGQGRITSYLGMAASCWAISLRKDDFKGVFMHNPNGQIWLAIVYYAAALACVI